MGDSAHKPLPKDAARPSRVRKRIQRKQRGLRYAASKWCLLVRDREALRRAHSVAASYLPPTQTEEGLLDFWQMSPELSRDARGLRVWLPLKMHGAAAFRAQLDEKLDLARYAEGALRQMAHVEIVAEPQLSLLAFRVNPPGRDGDALEEVNRRVIAHVNGKQRVLLTGAVVRGRFLIRICILSFRTHRDRIDVCLDDIRGSIEAVCGAGA
jgi:aromatic-L-amino-acid decarboxylase